MAKKRRRKAKGARARRLVVALAITIIVLGLAAWYLLQVSGLLQPAVELGDRLTELAGKHGAHGPDLRPDDPIRKRDGIFVRTWYITLPDDMAVAALVGDLEAEVSSRDTRLAVVEPEGGDLVRLNIDLGIEVFDLHLRVAEQKGAGRQPVAPTPAPSPTATPRPSPAPWQHGLLAIILDDAGQRLDLVPEVAALPEAVAVSVLPFLPHSSATAGDLHRSGHEVWLHLPMEPAGYPGNNPGPGAVLVAMSESDIRMTVRSALNNVPHVIGVNNHMGSRATADLRTMTWVMQEISARDLCFIDSRTAVGTVAEDAARSQGVPTGRRHIFLDNTRTRKAIRRQLDEAIYRARTEGRIIAIGHMVEETVRTLQAELPGISERGVDLVPPTRLLD
jgi:polysaccharide deacetylase 2 family uncharacterized protein YibQ